MLADPCSLLAVGNAACRHLQHPCTPCMVGFVGGLVSKGWPTVKSGPCRRQVQGGTGLGFTNNNSLRCPFLPPCCPLTDAPPNAEPILRIASHASFEKRCRKQLPTIVSCVIWPSCNTCPRSAPDKMSGLASKQQSLKIFEKLKTKPANKVRLFQAYILCRYLRVAHS